MSKESKVTKFHNDQSGFSLVELIIVIAIIGALTSGVLYSVNMIFSSSAKACANDIVEAISDCKVHSMGKADAWLDIYKASNGDVYSQLHVKNVDGSWRDDDPQRIGTHRVSIMYSVGAAGKDAATTDLLEGEHLPVSIRYDRGNGGFRPTGGDDNYISCIEVINGGKHYRLKLTKLTGKVEVETL